MKRLPAISLLCYSLIFSAWILDLFTPQLFVAAILYNGPIALSGLVLSTRLTAALVVFAEIANIVAGYVNGLQAGHHWDAIAVGDRMLAGASFLLVGFLTARAQEYSREAGSAMERARIAARERALRRAIEEVRATLNVDLVLRTIVREGLSLLGADEAMLVVRVSQLDQPDAYRIARGSQDTSLERGALNSSDATLLERTTDEVHIVTRGDPVSNLLLDAHDADAVAGVRISRGEGTVALFLFARQFPRGSERLLQAFAEGASVALDQARLFMQLGFRNDEIARQKRALEDRNRVIRDIVYALAHDLRTPLAANNVTVHQALDGAYGELPAPYREVLRTMLASNADLRRLVDTLLLVARFESGESSTLRERIDVADQAQRVVRELYPVADVKGVGLTCETEPASVEGDASEVRRAIANLVANAVEATPCDGHVTVRVTSHENDVLITVEDDGYGVSPEQREHLFARFAPGARALGGGTGLGLYIVRLIAQKLGGNVAYADRTPRGSTFTITLPAADASATNV